MRAACLFRGILGRTLLLCALGRADRRVWGEKSGRARVRGRASHARTAGPPPPRPPCPHPGGRWSSGTRPSCVPAGEEPQRARRAMALLTSHAPAACLAPVAATAAAAAPPPPSCPRPSALPPHAQSRSAGLAGSPSAAARRQGLGGTAARPRRRVSSGATHAAAAAVPRTLPVLASLQPVRAQLGLALQPPPRACTQLACTEPLRPAQAQSRMLSRRGVQTRGPGRRADHEGTSKYHPSMPVSVSSTLGGAL